MRSRNVVGIAAAVPAANAVVVVVGSVLIMSAPSPPAASVSSKNCFVESCEARSCAPPVAVLLLAPAARSEMVTVIFSVSEMGDAAAEKEDEEDEEDGGPFVVAAAVLSSFVKRGGAKTPNERENKIDMAGSDTRSRYTQATVERR